MTPQHPAWVEIDRAAMRHNFDLLRTRLRAATRIWAVCKGDAYGAGIVEAARLFLAAGATGIAIGDLADAERLRAAGTEAPILLYGATDGALAETVIGLGVIPTLFDRPSVEAYARLGRPLDAWVEIDCGFGRLGFTPGEWEQGLAALKAAPAIRVRGLYTHIGAVEDADSVARQARVFKAAAASAERAGFGALPLMAASSRVALAFPDLELDAVNPGRLLYGLLEGPWAARAAVRPAIAAVKARVLQVKDLAPGARIGYGQVHRSEETIRAAVLPIGFVAGLPRVYRGSVLLRGVRCPVLGLAAMEHLVVDASGAPGLAPGEEAVLLGHQGEETLTQDAVAAAAGLEVLELLPRLGRGLPRVYRN